MTKTSIYFVGVTNLEIPWKIFFPKIGTSFHEMDFNSIGVLAHVCMANFAVYHKLNSQMKANSNEESKILLVFFRYLSEHESMQKVMNELLLASR